jgi:hypothetical protein
MIATSQTIFFVYLMFSFGNQIGNSIPNHKNVQQKDAINFNLGLLYVIGFIFLKVNDVP